MLEALKDNGINIDYIAGTSSGSIIAAMYGMGYTPNEMLKMVVMNKDKIVDYDKGLVFKFLKLIVTKRLDMKGFVKGKKLEEILKIYSKKKGIESIKEIKIPLAIPIVNLITGGITYYLSNDITIRKEENIDIQVPKKKNLMYDDVDKYKNDGYIWDIVRASCSFPGVFVPKAIEGNAYIDGGIRSNTPVDILKKMGADKIISISFDCNNLNKSGIKNVICISNQSFNILSHDASENEIKNADVNVRICLEDISLLDFSNPVYLATEGQKAINKNINKIKEKLEIL